MKEGTFGAFDETNAIGSPITYAIEFEAPADAWLAQWYSQEWKRLDRRSRLGEKPGIMTNTH
jgi:hypothetical protein